MPSYYWIKLWIDLIDDYRMASLPDHLWRRAIEAFLLARTGGGDGHLPPIHEVSWKLRISPDTLEADLAELECITTRDGRPGIVQQIDGGWFVTNFAKRQASISDKERQRRKRIRDGEPSQNSHTPVTVRDLEEDVDVQTTEAEVDEQQTTETSEAVVAVVQSLQEMGLEDPKATEIAKKYEAAGMLQRLWLFATDWIEHFQGEENARNPVGLAIVQLEQFRAPPGPPPEEEEYTKLLGDHLCHQCGARPCMCEEVEA